MTSGGAAPPTRLSTGVAGLDDVLAGGLHPGGIYIIGGRPGAGKTILASQASYAHARAGGRVVFATLLAETHARLLSQLRTMSFFDESMVGRDVVYLNGLAAVLEGGLPGLLQSVRQMVREHGATLLVLDGMVTASAISPSLDYKKFIAELQTWVSVVGCTVLLVTSGGLDGEFAPEHTMVDGIVELRCEREQLRTLRYVTVLKLRSSAFVEGSHSYVITPDGVRVFPRFEARPMPDPSPEDVARFAAERASSGVAGLDARMGGGLVRGSTTLLLGASGTGKTILGLQFLAEGARRGEPGLYFGFFEPTPAVLAKGDRLGFASTTAAEQGLLFVVWRRPSETLLDVLAEEILALVRAKRVRRLFLDGFAGLHSAGQLGRVARVFSAVVASLVASGATVLVSDEARELFAREVVEPTPNVSALFHNIVFLRRLEGTDGAVERALVVLKTRDSDHDPRLARLEIHDDGIVVLSEPAASRGASAVVKGKAEGKRKASTKKTSRRAPPRRRKR